MILTHLMRWMKYLLCNIVCIIWVVYKVQFSRKHFFEWFSITSLITKNREHYFSFLIEDRFGLSLCRKLSFYTNLFGTLFRILRVKAVGFFLQKSSIKDVRQHVWQDCKCDPTAQWLIIAWRRTEEELSFTGIIQRNLGLPLTFNFLDLHQQKEELIY